MSAENPTEEELKDLVTITVPRVIAKAMNKEVKWQTAYGPVGF